MDLRKNKTCPQCENNPIPELLTALGITNFDEDDNTFSFSHQGRDRVLILDSPKVFLDSKLQGETRHLDEDLIDSGKFVIHVDPEMANDLPSLRTFLEQALGDVTGLVFSDDVKYAWHGEEAAPAPVEKIKVVAPAPKPMIKEVVEPERAVRLILPKAQSEKFRFGQLSTLLEDDEVEGQETAEELKPSTQIDPHTSLKEPLWQAVRLGPRSFLFINQEPRNKQQHVAVGYCRCSRPSQVQTTSLLNQEMIIISMAKTHRTYIRAIYSDQGISGARMAKREAMDHLMRNFQHGEYLLSLAIHRLSRTKDDLLAIKRRVVTENYGTIVTQELSVRLNEPTGDMFFDFLANMSQMERETISKRVRASIDYQVRTGTRKFKPKFGWRNLGPGVPLVEVPEEQQIIEIIRQLRNQGLTDNSIALQLTASHGHKGYNFNYSKVNRIRHQNDIK